MSPAVWLRLINGDQLNVAPFVLNLRLTLASWHSLLATLQLVFTFVPVVSIDSPLSIHEPSGLLA